MLQLKLSKVSLSVDGSQLVVQDTTGNYNASTNPGGYGTPNLGPASLVQLRWKMWNDCLWRLISGTYSVADIQAGYTIDTINIGLSTDSRLLPDGVEQVQLLEGYPVATKTLTTVSGSNEVDLNTFDIDDFTGFEYLSFQSIPNEIFKIINIEGTTIILDHPYTGSNSTELINQWYGAELPVLVQTFGNNRINKDLTGVTACCMEGKTLNNLMSRTMDSYAAVARFEAQDYLGANTLATAVANSTLIKKYGI